MKTIIVLTIEADKNPPKDFLIKALERCAYDKLTAKGIKVGLCQGGSLTQEVAE
ncbi:hypothetical protein UFOVP607_37 [uncultured Caudovirales phage]|uniref:Uncharacterized protein n=1 Tax=uncultured Caudovirales phage TaxID=2100421 RepID=A0A6J5N1D9_9CAUD|nr:hypothetical protein UFOVP607_37 [uncultured Caudovirales phage]